MAIEKEWNRGLQRPHEPIMGPFVIKGQNPRNCLVRNPNQIPFFSTTGPNEEINSISGAKGDGKTPSLVTRVNKQTVN